jgi:hypothetical protein
LGMVQEELLITSKTNINSQLKGQLLRNVVLQKLLQPQPPPLLPLFKTQLIVTISKSNSTEFKGKLLNWIIRGDEAVSCLEHPQLRDMLYYLQPSLKKRGYLPTGNTINNYIRARYFNSVPIIQDIISQSISKIHLSFDLWTSRQQIGFFGIHAHFYTPSGYQNILLALPRQSGHHTGIALARTLHEKLSSYGVTPDRIWVVCC